MNMVREVPIIVDMQKDFCEPGFAFDGPKADMESIKETVRKTGEFLDEYRENGGRPIIIKTVHGEDIDSEPWRQKYGSEIPCEKGTEGAELMDELNVQESDIVVEKNGFNGFQGTELDEILKDMGVDKVRIAGVMTEVCVEYTAQSAFNHGYHVSIMKDLTDSVYSTKSEAIEKLSNLFAQIE